MDKNHRQAQYDILIVGGGLVGGTLARALGLKGFRVAVIDAAPPPHQTNLDRRTSAIAASSYTLLKTLGLWEDTYATPIHRILISDETSSQEIVYDTSLLSPQRPMGYMVDNFRLREKIYQEASATVNVQWFSTCHPTSLSLDPFYAVLTTSQGVFNAPLLIGCDGKHSWVREKARLPINRWSYDQTAVIAPVSHPFSHQNVALERFTPEGPLALLPMMDHHSAVVWSANRALLRTITQMDDDAFSILLTEKLKDPRGPLTLAGPRGYYPLEVILPTRFITQRLALAGDAAHCIHPVAGQGVNLGFRDVATLVETLDQQRRLGMDIGSQSVLETYASCRRFDHLSMVVATDSVVRLFSNRSRILSKLRSLGLAAAEHIPWLKQKMMHHAMGLSGVLPPLLQER